MKRIRTSALLILSCILVVISFSACSNDLDLPIKEPQAPSSIYPLKDVHVTASGLVSTKLNKNAILHAARGFKAKDFVITGLISLPPVSWSLAVTAPLQATHSVPPTSVTCRI